MLAASELSEAARFIGRIDRKHDRKQRCKKNSSKDNGSRCYQVAASVSHHASEGQTAYGLSVFDSHEALSPFTRRYDMSVLDPDDPVSHLRYFVIVCDHNYGLCVLFRGDLKQAQYILPGLGVKIACRFIRQNDSRSEGQGSCYGHSLLLTARQLVREGLLLGRQHKSFQYLASTFSPSSSIGRITFS